jgi:uncharacterized protein with PQ loop repeat
LIEIVGFLGGAIGVGAGIPQLRVILKMGHFEGLSRVAWVLYYSGSIAWATYGWRAHSPSALVSNVIAAIINVSIVTRLFQKRFRILFPVLAAFIFFLINFLPLSMVTAILISFTCAQLPQVRASFKNYQNNQGGAVSLATVFATTSSYFCWATYGILSSLITIWTTSLLGLIQSVAIIAFQLPFLRGRLPIPERKQE